MKTLLYISLLALSISIAHAQNNVGIGTLLPNSEAILELSAADKGFLMTRLNAADTSLFVGNTEGMMFYAVDIDRILYYGAGNWNPISIGGVNVWELIGNDISNINSGNVGIGISSPQNLLHVSGTDATSDGSSGVWAKINNQVVGTGPVSTGFLFGTYNNPSSGTKGGIFFRRSGAFGVGDLIFSSNSNLDPGNVDASDTYVKMIIENGGNVGIGTVSPSVRLDVEQIPTAGPSARFFNGNIPYDDTGFQNSGIAFHSASVVAVGAVSTIAALPQLSGNYPSILSFRTAPNGSTPTQERLRILANGNVGIGSFDAVNLLDVPGNMAIGSSFAGTSSAPSNSLIVEGSIGIGNNSPAYPLHLFSPGTYGNDFGSAVIYGNSSFNSNAMVLEGNNTGNNAPAFVYSNAFLAGYALNPTGTNNYGLWGHQPGTGVGGYGVLATNGPDKTTPNRYVALAGTTYSGIFSGGNVGIGTTNPFRTLEVSGTGLQATRIISTNFLGATVELIRPGGGGNDFRMFNNATLRFQFDANEFGVSATDVMTIGSTGNVNVIGFLSKGGGSFKIDHPQDPANKYLYHSFVESPDMMNVYNGNITTDANGEAVIQLPDYFGTLNKDFRYQLTPIGQFAQLIVLQEVDPSTNSFTIKSDQANVKVSWQVTGIRKDPWAEANRIQDVVEKKPAEKGYYLHPALYGQPINKQIGDAPVQVDEHTSLE
ncbi:MAG: hypothetical protein RH860_15790 [Cytophagales bacterium]